MNEEASALRYQFFLLQNKLKEQERLIILIYFRIHFYLIRGHAYMPPNWIFGCVEKHAEKWKQYYDEYYPNFIKILEIKIRKMSCSWTICQEHDISLLKVIIDSQATKK